MNNGRYDDGHAIYHPFATVSEGSAYPRPVHGTFLDYPATPVLADEESGRSSDEIEEAEIDDDGQELPNQDIATEGTFAENFNATAGPSFTYAEENTQARHLFGNFSRFTRRPYLTLSRAANPSSPHSSYQLAPAIGPSTTSNAVRGGSSHHPIQQQNIQLDEAQLMAANQRRQLLRQAQHPSWNRRRGSNRPVSQDCSFPSISGTVLEVPTLQPCFNIGSYNLRPRGLPMSSGAGRGRRRESFSRTVNSDGLHDDTESESQTRKRRRAGSGRCPAAASSSVPTCRSRPASLQGRSAPVWSKWFAY